MKAYLIVVPGYPSENDKYNNGFVHSRVKNYINNNIKVEVFSLTKSVINKKGKYIYEGVNVFTGNYSDLNHRLKKSNYQKVLIHFAFKRTVKTIMSASPKTPLIIWIHGVEALGWYRRLFNLRLSYFLKFAGYVIFNTRQMLFMRKLIRGNYTHVKFIFVSKWMKRILEKDTLSKNRVKNYSIIPNVIDEKVFNYRQKKRVDRLRILSIRPYATKKYANDLMVKAIIELSDRIFFNELTFTIYGDGRLFNKTIAPLRCFKNVKIHKQFLSHNQIAEIHKENGICLIPTRQDAQGVSMCEAMSSGLVPITSNNTAIPEFVPEGCGYLTSNVKELAAAIEELYYSPDKFLSMSENASSFIREKCSVKKAIDKEIMLITYEGE